MQRFLARKKDFVAGARVGRNPTYESMITGATSGGRTSGAEPAWNQREKNSMCGDPISQGSTCQISEAYSWMVRSEENFPARATFRIAFRIHPLRSLYAASTRSCVWM